MNKAIYYAADNGAKIINMSFGIPWAKRSATIYDAIKYAINKDILIIHASGNNGENLDKKDIILPDRKTLEGQAVAPYWMGLAAVIGEYYPKLTAAQVKEIIMKSVVKVDALKDKCVSGGIINAYNAFSYLLTRNK